ncbi:acyl-CoA dehydrogenase family protein [Pseudarthrobacter sulfonivorans]
MREDSDVWADLIAEQDLMAMLVPKDLGGWGSSFLDLCVVFEELGRRLLPSPYFATALAAVALREIGDVPARELYLPKIGSGALTATLAYPANTGASASAGLSVRQTRDGWLLDGQLSHVLDGTTADVILLLAPVEEHWVLLSVEGSAPGLSRHPMETLDLMRPQSRIEFSGVQADRIGDATQSAIDAIHGRISVLHAAEQVGGAQQCLDMAVAYAKERVQFERAIGSFQATKHKCSEMLRLVETARAAVYAAAVAIDSSDPDVGFASSAAAAFAAETYLKVTSDNIQIHGGIAFQFEHPAHLYFRRARGGVGLFGGTRQHRESAVRFADL